MTGLLVRRRWADYTCRMWGMMSVIQHRPHSPKPRNEAVSQRPKHRLGVVSYLNARPLIAGLAEEPDIELIFEVPSRLPEMLAGGEVDVALVPVIDLMRRGSEWQIVSDACIGCDGETLTVRVFSRVPPERITKLHVDGDSHTSVALARVIWR